jgi:inorganic pyrophosphatase
MGAGTSLDKLPLVTEDAAVRVVVEANAGSRNKLKYEPASGTLELHHVLPLGTSFPYDFGFLPSTVGGDGDPLDAIVFADEPVPPGTVVACRLVGVIEAEQGKPGGPRNRNDRFLAVARLSHVYRDWHNLGDIPQKALDELEAFFVSYNAQRGVDFQPLARGDAARATELMTQGRRG